MDSTDGSTEGNTLEIYLKKMLETLLTAWFEIYLIPEEYLAVTMINVLNDAADYFEDPAIKDCSFTLFDPEIVGMSLATDPEFGELLFLLFGTEIGPEELEMVAKRTAVVAFESALDFIEAGMDEFPDEEWS